MGGVQGPTLGPLVGSRGKAPGGDPGGSAPRNSGVLDPLNAVGGLIFSYKEFKKKLFGCPPLPAPGV